jgi:NAD(P)-dependent dehydrogenase (short-subunit alcohol dehydrogenase family)
MSMSAYANYPSLRDRSVLITGGASGIGAALVEHFAAQGARVAFLDLDHAASAALAQSLADAATPPMFIACDLADTAALRAAIATARERLGPLDILINNAGNDARHRFAEVTPEQFDRIVAVNLRQQFFAAQAVAPDMRAQGGGAIVCLGSTGWMQKNAGYPVYATAKSAIAGLVRALARELGPDRIRVNALVPGWVMTEKQQRLWLDAEGEAQIARMQCLQARLQPADIARMALFLAADDSAMCTGQDFIVDGGWV